MTQTRESKLEELLGGSTLVRSTSGSYCVGRQVVGDLYLKENFDFKPMPGIILSSALEAGATPLTMSFSEFDGKEAKSYEIIFSNELPKHPSYAHVDKTADFSVVLIVSESHYAFHYFKRMNYAVLDIYTCGEVDPMVSYGYVLDHLGNFLKGENHQFFERGVISPDLLSFKA